MAIKYNKKDIPSIFHIQNGVKQAVQVVYHIVNGIKVTIWEFARACFSRGWNNDKGWDNDAGWSND